MKNIRIAIIEDHDLTCAGLGEALKKRKSFEVVGEAANGMHGLELLESTQPDIAIVDIGLPDIDGIEVVRRFRQTQSQPEKLRTKIVILAPHKVQDILLEAFAAGADSYCIKDSLDKLEEAIRLTHQGNPWIDPSVATIVATQARRSDEDIEGQSVSTDWVEKLEQEYKDVFLSAGITDQEIEIFLLIVQGYDNVEIACHLNITVDEAETCIRSICNKFHADFYEASNKLI
jgi:two-component system, NarL family, response regulator LiaR